MFNYLFFQDIDMGKIEFEEYDDSIVKGKIQCDEFNNRFLIFLPRELRNGVWAESYRPIQEKLRNLKNEVNTIIIDAHIVEWVDPIPMLSILISIAEVHETKNTFFVISDLEKMSENQKKVFEFLYQQGFLTEQSNIEKPDNQVISKFNMSIITYSEINLINKVENNVLKDKTVYNINWIHNNLDGFVNYNNSRILTARVVDLNNINNIDNTIESELDYVKHRISSHLQDSQLNEIIWKMGLFLKETINNVSEHAYKDTPNKYVGYYIRHLVGLADNSLNKLNIEKILQVYKNENRDVSRFLLNFPMEKTGFIEIYVVDAGIGLTEHFTSKRNIKKSFTEAWRETVGLGKRSDETVKKNTQFGGLYTLGKLLDRDFLLACDYDCWIGDILPINKNNYSYIASNTKNNPNNYVKGLSIMCRLATQKPMDNNGWILSKESTKCFIDASKEEQDIYQKYYGKSFKKLPYILSNIKDSRFNLSFLKPKNYLDQEYGVKFCFVLPSEHESKNDIYEKINSIKPLVEIGNASKTIIIADIPICECGLYQLSIENAFFKRDFINAVDQIVLISQRLSVRVLEKKIIEEGDKKAHVYRYSEKLTKEYIVNRPSDFSPHQSLFHTIEWLKTHDSMIVWEYILSKYFYINEDILWYKDNDEKYLNGYLDFEKTLTDSFLKNVYHYALQRIFCFSESSTQCIFMYEDPLMAGLVNYMNMVHDNVTNSNLNFYQNKKIALGSVYVSGATQPQGVDYHINMFLHKDSCQYVKRNSVMHLFAWVKNIKTSNNSIGYPLRRVGSTYAIAPFGWRYFPIPRYKAFKNDIIVNKYFFKQGEASNIEFKSIYNCLPRETYNYWQGKRGMFVGISHVDYETKHDILNINFPFIVKESFLLGGDLACFLLGEIVTAFGLIKEDLNFHGNDKFEEDVMKYKKQNIEKYKNRKCSFLIYPYHTNTEQIIDSINYFIKEEDKNNKKVKMIPLIPINKERNGTSFLPSPITIEMLKEEIDTLKNNSKSEINVLLFDDAIIDGKTQEEIKNIMYLLGVHHVKSLFILERRRLPFNTSDYRRTSVFWRLDIPRLGPKYSCPLCTALNSISIFSSQIISENAKKRVNEWINTWGAKTESILERTQTLYPVKIQLKQNNKRFGIYFEGGICKQCGGESNKIELSSSLGLTLYMGELLSITCRDDKMLQYCSENYGLDSLAILEMLCTNLLLYGKTISRKVREKIVLNIFNKANSFVEEYNHHTSFAALVLMTQEKEVLSCLIDEYEKMKGSNRMPNYDMLILFSYLSSNKMKFGEFEDVGKLRLTSMKDDKIYRIFHSELFNGNGKSHDRPIQRIIDNAINSTIELRRTEDSIDCIIYALEHIHEFNLVVNNNEESISIEKTIEFIKKTKVFLQENGKKIDDYKKNKENFKRKFDELFNILEAIHKRLFCPLNLINDDSEITEFELRKRVESFKEKVSEKFGGKYDIGFFNFEQLNVEDSHNIFERWIIWDKTVIQEIEYLIDNAHEHSYEKFRMSDDLEDMHRVWISIKYADDYSSLSLLLYNKRSLQNTANHIEKESAKKPRYGKYRLAEELGVITKWKDRPNDIIETKITFQLL